MALAWRGHVHAVALSDMGLEVAVLGMPQEAVLCACVCGRVDSIENPTLLLALGGSGHITCVIYLLEASLRILFVAHGTGGRPWGESSTCVLLSNDGSICKCHSPS